MDILSIGTVVVLKGGKHKLMITARTPLENRDGTIGYYDYGACLYPEGQVNNKTYFFNTEDIEEVIFEGYCDENEIKCKEIFKEKICSIKYPHFRVEKR